MSELYTYTNNYKKINIEEIPWLNYTSDEILDMWIQNDTIKSCKNYYGEPVISSLSNKNKVLTFRKNNMVSEWEFKINHYNFQINEFKNFLEKNNSWIIAYDENYALLNVFHLINRNPFIRPIYTNTINTRDNFISDLAHFSLNMDFKLSDQLIDMISKNTTNFKEVCLSDHGDGYARITHLKINFLENNILSLKDENLIIKEKLKKLEDKVNSIYTKKYD